MSSTATVPTPTSSTPPTPLDQLEAAIQSLAGSGPSQSIDLNLLSRQIPGLPPLLKRLPGGASHLTGLTLTPAPGSLTLEGTLTILNAPFSVSAVCTLAGQNIQFVLTGTQGATPLTLLALLGHLNHPAPHTPDVSLTGLSLALGTDKGDFTLTGLANWAVPFGATPSVSMAAQVALTSTTALITGALSVGSLSFSVTCNLAKDANTLTALWTNHTSPVTWDTLVTAAGVSAGRLPPGMAAPAFTNLELTLGFSDRSLSFLAETVSGADAFLVVRNGGAWGFFLGVDQGTGKFELGNISSDLRALDFLSISDAYLIAASCDYDGFVVPTDTAAANCPPAPPAIHLAQGLNFGAQLTFQDGPGRAHTLNTLFGHLPQVSVSGSLNVPDHVSVKAAIASNVAIPKTPLQLVAPSLTVTLDGDVITAAVATGLIIPLGSGQTPLTLTGSLTINETQATMTGNAAADYTINAPFGLHGLVLQDLGVLFGLAFDPDPGFSIGIEAAFALGGSLQPGEMLAVDLDVSPETLSVEPVYLYGKASQPITLPLLVSTVVPQITLPAFFNNFSLSNLLISYAEPPGQKLIDGTAIAAGYAFSGTLSVYSFSMAAALDVNLGGGPAGTSGTPGVTGSFQMSPISVDNAVSITGVTTPGLYFAFSTGTANAPSPMVSGQAKVTILGATGSQVYITLNSSGLIFSIGVTAGSSQLTLNCSFIQQMLNASCHLQFNLNASFSLSVPGTGEYIGKIAVNTTFTGTLGLEVSAAGATLSLSGNFDGRTLPGGSYTAPTNALQDVAVTVTNRITAQAELVFTDITLNPSKWASLVSSGVITDADKAKNDASSAFGQAWSSLTSALTNAGNTIVKGVEGLGKDLGL